MQTGDASAAQGGSGIPGSDAEGLCPVPSPGRPTASLQHQLLPGDPGAWRGGGGPASPVGGGTGAEVPTCWCDRPRSVGSLEKTATPALPARSPAVQGLGLQEAPCPSTANPTRPEAGTSEWACLPDPFLQGQGWKLLGPDPDLATIFSAADPTPRARREQRSLSAWPCPRPGLPRATSAPGSALRPHTVGPP